MSQNYHWWNKPNKVEDISAYLDKLFQPGETSPVNQQLKKIIQKKMEEGLSLNQSSSEDEALNKN